MKLGLITCLLLALAWSFTSAQASCDRPINANSAIMFIDVNGSRLEVEAAKAAACQRGQKLVVMPEDYVARGHYRDEHEELSEAYEASQCQFNSSKYCQKLTQRFNAFKEKMYKLSGTLSTETVGKKLLQLQQLGVKVQAIVISGHAGADGFFSDFMQENLIMINELGVFLGQHHMSEQIQELYLWGCYTATPEMLEKWNVYLPNLKWIAGFYDQAPYSILPASGSMLKSMMIKAPIVLNQATTYQAAQVIDGVHSIYDTNSALYLKLKQQPYYWQAGELKSYGALTMSCDEARALLPRKQMIWQNYYRGSVRDANPHNGPLRQLYSFIRQQSHCFKSSDHMPSYDQVLGLLFYENVMQNFRLYLASYIDMIPLALRQNWGDDWLQVFHFGLTPAQKAKFWLPSQTKLMNSGRKEIIANVQRMGEVIKQLPPATPSLTDPYKMLRRLHRDMDTYLVKIKCVQGWHDLYLNALRPSC